MVEGNGLNTMDVFPKIRDSAMPVNTKPTNRRMIPMNSMVGETSETKGCINPRGGGRTLNEKIVISQGTITLEPSKNTVIIIECRADQNHEHNRVSCPCPMSPTISLRNLFKSVAKPPNRLSISKYIKVNKTFKKQVNAKKKERNTYNHFIRYHQPPYVQTPRVCQ